MEVITNGIPHRVGRAYCYDLDGTIITTVSGNVFPRNENDWKFLFPNVPNILKTQGQDSSTRIIIFTNQLRYNSMKASLIRHVIKALDIPIEVYIATARDTYRKPGIDMFTAANQYHPIDVNTSFYCGDAADRATDHSGADYWFAAHLGLRFVLPEVIFEGRHDLIDLPNRIHQISSLQIDLSSIIPTGQQEVVIMMGLPGCGKTTLARHLFPNYVHISPDYDGLTTESRRLKKINEALSQGHSVVVDQTHLSKKSRAYLLPFHPRAIYITTPIEICEKMIEFRSCFGGVHVPSIALRKLASSYEPPHELRQVDILERLPPLPEVPLYVKWLLWSRT